MSSNILVIDDEVNILELIKFNLELNNHNVYTAENGKQGIEKINELEIDLIILDLMMPVVDGIQVCKYVRGKENLKTIPIIMLTAKSTETDKIFGLEIGADDYITKPFEAEELMARIRAQLRREKDNEKNAEKNILKIDDLVMDKDKYTVSREGDNIELTKKEYDLLKYFLENKDIVLSRDQLLEAVWGYDYVGQTNIVDVYIRYLRSKIDDPYDKKLIKTVRGVGYVIRDEENV